MSINKQTVENVASWASRSLIALLVFLALEIYTDVKQLAKDQPVMSEKIHNLEEGQKRLTQKVFPALHNQSIRDFFKLLKIR